MHNHLRRMLRNTNFDPCQLAEWNGAVTYIRLSWGHGITETPRCVNDGIQTKNFSASAFERHDFDLYPIDGAEGFPG